MMAAQRHPPALTLQELEDQIGCNKPACECDHPISILSKCHPDEPVRVALDQEGGSLWVHCICGNVITNIMIARAPVH